MSYISHLLWSKNLVQVPRPPIMRAACPIRSWMRLAKFDCRIEIQVGRNYSPVQFILTSHTAKSLHNFHKYHCRHVLKHPMMVYKHLDPRTLH